MADTHLRALLRHVRRLASPNGPGAPSDAELLDRFLVTGDRAAFELLTWRHGPMVFGVCRRVLRHEQDAEDAFQATFLALARKGGSVARRGAVGGWLYTVAYRVALAAKARAGRTPPHAPLTDVAARSDGADWCDVRPVLDEEIGRLPDRYRVPFVLCYLEGLTVDEVARRLGRPRGTVGTRLARARERLRSRLAARGVGLSAVALTSILANEASAGLPAGLAIKALKAASAGPAAPAPILTLADGVLRAMFVSQLKSGVSVLVTVVALGAGGLALQTQAQDRPPAAVPGTPPRSAANPAPAERLTLRGWGTAVDPDGDCTFAVAPNGLTVGTPASDHVLGVERGRMNAPRVLQEVEGDFIAQVRVAGEFPKGAKTVVPQRRPLFVAGLLLYQDDRNYVRLERGDLNREGTQFHYVNWELRTDGRFVRQGSPGEGDLNPQAPAWLRLERRGDRLIGSYSADAVTWTGLEPLALKLPAKVHVGVTVGNNTTTAFAATFEGWQLFRCVAGAPAAEAPPSADVRGAALELAGELLKEFAVERKP